MKLNARLFQTAKPREKEYKLADGNGLFLQIRPDGAKYWRLRYRYEDKEKMLSLGINPATSLALARRQCEDAKRLLAEGKNLTEKFRLEKLVRNRDAEILLKQWLPSGTSTSAHCGQKAMS